MQIKKWEVFIGDTPGIVAQALREGWEPLNGQCLNGGFVWFFRREIKEKELPPDLKKKAADK
jgi:hypothetical protein